MSTTDENIITQLRHLAHVGEPMDLLNVYQGLPVLYRAQALLVGDDRAVISFQQPEAVCLQLEGKTTILSELLAGPVNAAVEDVDLQAGRAVVHSFSYSFKVGHRMSVRVTLAHPASATLSSGLQQLTGTAADIGMTGVGVILSTPEAAQTLRRGAVVLLRLTLEAAPLELSGLVRYVRGSRVGVTLMPTAAARSLHQYVHLRQEEILNELRAHYQAAGGALAAAG